MEQEQNEQVLFTLPLSRLRPIFQSWMKQVIAEIDSAEAFDPDERITRADIRRIYKVSLPTIHNCMKRGLPYEKVGRKTLFRRADVDAYFQKKGQKKA